MEKEKKPKIVKPEQFCFSGGVCLCLFSIILIMNIGAIARVLTYVPFYLFGNISYLISVGIFAIGIYLLFKEKPLNIKFSYRIFAYLILFIAILMISTTVSVKANNFDFDLANEGVPSFKDAFKTYAWSTITDGYIKCKDKLSVFGSKNVFGGGAVGYFITGLFMQKIGKSAAIVFIVLFILIGVAIILVPFFLKKYKNTSVKKERGVSSVSNNNYYSMNNEPVRPVTPVREVENYDVLTPAREVPLNRESEIIGAPSAPKEEEYVNNNYFGNGQVGGGLGQFVPAHFYRDGMPQAQNLSSSTDNRIKLAEQPEQTNYNDQAVQTIIESKYESAKDENKFMQEQNPEYHPVEPQPQPVQQPEYTQPMPTVMQREAFDKHINDPIRENPEEHQGGSILEGLAPNTQPAQPAPAQKAVIKKTPLKWVPPSNDLLEVRDATDAIELNKATAEKRANDINKAFIDYGIDAQIIDFTIGPSVTRYNVTYGTHTSVKSVRQSVEDVAIRVGGLSARFEAIVEGQTTSGIEIQNAKITTVGFKEVFDELPDAKKHPLAVAFGKNIEGGVIYADLDEFPHALIAGTTGSGKSVFVNSLICTLIMRNSPDNLKMVLIDPKKVEFGKYKEMPHLLTKIITNATEAKNLMYKLVEEMERRYETFENSPHGATNIKEYNKDCETYNDGEKYPYIVVVIDEYADLVDNCKDIAMPVCSLAQKARACGIHILLATQRPSTQVVNGVLKGNLPTHIALSVASFVDSNVILGEAGAEKLLGKGDMLVQSPIVSRNGCVRIQSCYIDRLEIARLVGYLKNHYTTQYDERFLDLQDKAEEAGTAYVNSPEFKSNVEDSDEKKYQEIKNWVMAQEYMSMSRIQRECSVGFNRAGRIFKQLQEEGVIGMNVEGNKGCPVLQQNKFGDADGVDVDSSDYSEIGGEHH